MYERLAFLKCTECPTTSCLTQAPCGGGGSWWICGEIFCNSDILCVGDCMCSGVLSSLHLCWWLEMHAKNNKQHRGANVQVPCHLALIACTTVLEQPVHKGFEILCLALPHLYTHSLSDNEISPRPFSFIFTYCKQPKWIVWRFGNKALLTSLLFSWQ